MVILPPGVRERYSLHLDKVRAAVPADDALDLSALSDLQFVFLCFTNRCGSNLVAETLASDGQLNLATECWHADEVIRVAGRQPPLGFRGYFRGVSWHNMQGGRFVSKLGIEHVTLLQATGVLEPIIGRCRFILVERSDKLAQAISLAIAEATSGWASYVEAVRPASDLVFSREAVDVCLDLILDQSALFDRFFAANGIVPTGINYEQFVQHPGHVTMHAGSALGLPALRNVPLNVRVTRQSGATNRLWRDLYLAGAG